jgi:predicted AlkP superfamily pyrophosphatase or phosphodiesterase
MPPLRFLALAALSLLLVACATTPSSTEGPAPVLLISIDSFRADYLDRGVTPNLTAMARRGVRARWMSPSYPSLTFPNHYTLVTGLRPDHHAIVHNTMRDATLGEFQNSDEKAVREPRWWSGEPLWVTAEKSGLRTATLFWPGSEAPIKGVWPTDWLKYDDAMPMPQRVDIVLGWLTRPPSARPRFTTLYFGALDHTAHDFGPDAPETNAMLAEVDDSIGRLLWGLSARGLGDRVNIVIVSDHGMAAVPYSHSINIETLVSPSDATYTTVGEVIGFIPQAGHEAAAEAKLLGRHDHSECWRKSELPSRWHYGAHPRIPPIVCQMDVGWEAVTPQKLAARKPGAIRGSHGYDPDDPSMRALFIGQGPAFRQGKEVAPFDNVDVYPLLARLLGVEPNANDGDIDALLPALKP